MTQADFDNSPKATTSTIGTVKYKDINNDGKVDLNDMTFIGDPNPKFIFGIVNSFTYKNVDLNITATGAVGGKIFDGTLEWMEVEEGLFNVLRYVKDRWRSPENPGAGIMERTGPSTFFHRARNSRYVFDGTYLTIKNVTLGYTLPYKTKYFSKIRLYGSIQQALTFSKYYRANPEVSVAGLNGLNQGMDAAAYPVPRTFSVGLNVNF
jgi:hypothetical protein